VARQAPEAGHQESLVAAGYEPHGNQAPQTLRAT
jgi:hypothetical protein